MEKTWYYAAGGERRGPVSFAELRGLAASGALTETDLVWQPEFGGQWRVAGGVRELFAPPAVTISRAPEITVKPDVPLLGVVGRPPSCLSAIHLAYERTVAVLFKPFDITRWLSIGFCAWLAYLGTQSSLNFGNPIGEVAPGSFKQQADKALDSLMPGSMGVAEWSAMIGGLMIVLLFELLVCKVRSRGDFMFLHRWYKPNETIRLCWAASRESGDALFRWRIAFFVISALLLLCDAAAVYVYVLEPYVSVGKVWDGALVRPAVCCMTGLLLLITVIALVAHLTKAFVVPVMYWHGVSAGRAWLAVLSLCNQYPFALMGYLVCGAACSLAAAVGIVAACLLTCCIGFIPLILPFVGTVVLLPCYYFFRGYPVFFLSQWRDDLVPDLT